jgi:RNA polymerase sigma-70 factor, ECF subfamily
VIVPPSLPTQARRAAFEREALPHVGRLYGAARRLSAGGADAEDLVQETLLRAYRSFDSFEPGTNCRAWLLTILYSVFANRYRRAKREPVATEPEQLEREAARAGLHAEPDLVLLLDALRGRWGLGSVVEQALNRLSEEQRQAVLLVDLEELTYEEAAAALGCPVGTVRSRLSRARRFLAAELAEHAHRLGFPVRATQ